MTDEARVASREADVSRHAHSAATGNLFSAARNCAASVEPDIAVVEDLPPGHRHGDRVEIARADLALMAHGGKPGRLGLELAFLHLRIGRHAAARIIARQLEHRQIERMEARERHELEAIAHGGELFLEALDRAGHRAWRAN